MLTVMPEPSAKPARSAFDPRNRVAWGIFGTGLALLPLGWVLWINRVGVEWWIAYRHASGLGPSADRLRCGFVVAGLLVCLAAPFFAAGLLRRKLLLSALAALVAVAFYYLCGFIWFLLYGV